MRGIQKKPEDFTAFYHRYVGLGEGCGCAERVIDIHEANRLAGPEVREIGARRSYLNRLRVAWAKLRGIGNEADDRA